MSRGRKVLRNLKAAIEPYAAKLTGSLERWQRWFNSGKTSAESWIQVTPGTETEALLGNVRPSLFIKVKVGSGAFVGGVEISAVMVEEGRDINALVHACLCDMAKQMNEAIMDGKLPQHINYHDVGEACDKLKSKEWMTVRVDSGHVPGGPHSFN